jgi:hypothetical protein
LLKSYILEVAKEILMEDNPISLRRLHYLLVGKIKAVYANTHDNYDDLCIWTAEARKKGTLDYSWFCDETRTVEAPYASDNAAHYASMMLQHGYHRDRFQNQPFRIELWVEKDTVLSVVRETCSELQITLRSMHGQASNSMCYQAATDWEAYDPDVAIHILVYTDLDCDGLLTIPVSAQERTQTILTDFKDSDRKVTWHRLGFNYEDFLACGIESIEAKTDSKMLPKYLKVIPDGKCSELEALSKTEMVSRIHNKVIELLDSEGDMKAWLASDAIEAKEKKQLMKLLDKMDTV